MQDAESDLSPADFIARSNAGEMWQLIDVREGWELELARLETATPMPMSQIHTRVEELDKQVPIAVLCHSGIRSAQVAAWLRQLGFERVANITGGIDAWSVTVDPSVPRY
ncbi:MAG: rhodanese-like domain-containing protein [Woeseiaceae bacterium]|jgi:rhodanese-related sulfurtransferase|nr:rhodanese-like domain-containing protein [Woeseiaceae bacterium]